jgi:MacB-like periplasmic core domain
VLGRTFDETEGEPGGQPAVILSYGLWQASFAADRTLIGRNIRMGGRLFTVVGVMPDGFLFCDPAVRFWVPLVFSPAQKQIHHANNWFNIGRLRPGATIAQVQSQVNAINAANLENAGGLREFLISTGFETRAESLKAFLTRDAQSGLELLWAAALVVLLIGALNAAGLVAARTSVRRREMGTRLALGAGLRRLASQIAGGCGVSGDGASRS